MNYFDFHCDTATGLYRSGELLEKNSLHIDLCKSRIFRDYCQVSAFFCPPAVRDIEGMSYVETVYRHFCRCVSDCPDAALVTDRFGLENAFKNGQRAFIPAVEDARILDGNPENISRLSEIGIRFVTLLWKGISCIGGAHNTDSGLTDFGREAVSAFLRLHIIPDVSHASVTSFWDVASICVSAGKPFVATHSCASSVCPHTRNLTDEQLRAVAKSGGIVGLNLYPPFLSLSGKADLHDVSLHLRHIRNVIGTESMAIGADFDGVDALPSGMRSLSDIPLIADALSSAGFTQDEAEAVFSENGRRFLVENL